MAKYLIYGSYTTEGLQGLLKEGGTGRRKAVEQALAGLGGSSEAFYYAFGDMDVLVIADLPDNVSAASLSLLANSTGTVKVKTAVLMTPEEVDAATKKTVNYRPPGQ